jgi:hypothetical protein
MIWCDAVFVFFNERVRIVPISLIKKGLCLFY